MSTTICPRCGAENPENTRICGQCRINLVYAFEHPEEVELIKQEDQKILVKRNNQSNDRKKRRKISNSQKFIFGCFTVLLVISSIIGLSVGANDFRWSNDIKQALNTTVTTSLQSLGIGTGTILLFLCLFSPIIIWLWALTDCIINESSTGNDKLVWILIILFTNFIGGILYFLIRRPQRKTD